jgi:peptidoglycan hydrolase CwlO-like protein
MSSQQRQVKHTGTILFEAVLAFIGASVFPLGFIIYIAINFISSQVFNYDNPSVALFGTLTAGILASLFLIINELNKNMTANNNKGYGLAREVEQLKQDKEGLLGTIDALQEDLDEMHDSIEKLQSQSGYRKKKL